MTDMLGRLRGQSAEFSKTISESDVYLFAGLTGDLSPYHVNAEVMRRSSYGERLVHGVLVLGVLSTASSLFWQDTSRAGQGVSLGYDRVRFTHPVFIGDTVTARYEVTVWDHEKERYVADGVVTNQDGDVCLVATHVTKAVAIVERGSGGTDQP